MRRGIRNGGCCHHNVACHAGLEMVTGMAGVAVARRNFVWRGIGRICGTQHIARDAFGFSVCQPIEQRDRCRIRCERVAQQNGGEQQCQSGSKRSGNHRREVYHTHLIIRGVTTAGPMRALVIISIFFAAAIAEILRC